MNAWPLRKEARDEERKKTRITHVHIHAYRKYKSYFN